MTAPAIRPYRPDDLDALYEVCLRTGAAGDDASDLMGDPRLLGDLFVAPYAVLEPEHAFVIDDGTGRAQAYVVGALDTRAFEARCDREWWPDARSRHPGPTGAGVLDDLFIGYLHGLQPAPDDVVAAYPSHLHIDLLPPVQSGGWGRRMMETMFEALRVGGSVGLHLNVSDSNQRALGFYDHLGFTELRRDPMTHTLGLRL